MSMRKWKQCCNTVVAAPPWCRQSHSLSLCPYSLFTQHTFSLPTVSIHSLYCALLPLYVYLHACYCTAPVSFKCMCLLYPQRAILPMVYVRAYLPYYVIPLLILLFCHPTILFTLGYLNISMFPSLLSVLPCLSSKALERLASLASLAYCDCLYVLSSVS
jgi:hypothetical protein